MANDNNADVKLLLPHDLPAHKIGGGEKGSVSSMKQQSNSTN
jgi:hypothetical protein